MGSCPTQPYRSRTVQVEWVWVPKSSLWLSIWLLAWLLVWLLVRLLAEPMVRMSVRTTVGSQQAPRHIVSWPCVTTLPPCAALTDCHASALPASMQPLQHAVPQLPPAPWRRRALELQHSPIERWAATSMGGVWAVVLDGLSETKLAAGWEQPSARMTDHSLAHLSASCWEQPLALT